MVPHGCLKAQPALAAGRTSIIRNMIAGRMEMWPSYALKSLTLVLAYDHVTWLTIDYFHLISKCVLLHWGLDCSDCQSRTDGNWPKTRRQRFAQRSGKAEVYWDLTPSVQHIGSGLGLALVRQIVKLSHGRLGVRSTPDKVLDSGPAPLVKLLTHGYPRAPSFGLSLHLLGLISRRRRLTRVHRCHFHPLPRLPRQSSLRGRRPRPSLNAMIALVCPFPFGHLLVTMRV